jgi:hypothetical protein
MSKKTKIPADWVELPEGVRWVWHPVGGGFHVGEAYPGGALYLTPFGGMVMLDDQGQLEVLFGALELRLLHKEGLACPLCQAEGLQEPAKAPASPTAAPAQASESDPIGMRPWAEPMTPGAPPVPGVAQ